MSNLLFDRIIRVKIDGESRAFDGFDIDFRVEKQLRAEPNNAQVKLYNLPPDYRSQLKKGASVLELECGYRSASTSVTRITKADIRFVDNRLSGPDWITTIDAGESEASIRKARINKSLGKTSLKTVVEELAKTFENVNTGNLNTVGFTEQVNAWSGSGPSHNLLDKILRSYKYGYTINQDTFVFVKLGKPRDDLSLMLDENSGLIGSPEITEKRAEKPDKDSTKEEAPRRYVKLRSLLRGQIEAGLSIDLKSVGLKGKLVAESVTHYGSNYDNDFYTDLEAFFPS